MSLGHTPYCLETHLEICNWESEASPTLGCSIEISHDIYIYIYVGWLVGMSVVSKNV